jgi:hypothetical protein
MAHDPELEEWRHATLARARRVAQQGKESAA